MKVLILMSPAGTPNPEKLGAVLPAETHHAWQLYKSGTVRECYFRGDGQGAVLVLEVADLAEAHKVASSLPLVEGGFATIQAIPLLPFTGWERLSAH